MPIRRQIPARDKMKNCRKPIRFFRRGLALSIALLTLIAASACGGGAAASKLQGPPGEILAGVIEEAGKAMPADRPMPMCFDMEATAETSQYTLGLSADDFEKYVSSATVYTAAIATFAHEIALIQAKDASAAAEVKKRIAGEGGFDSRKWICVFPEESCAIDSGAYVLLVSSRADVAEALVAAFTEAAGSTGERNTFFTSEGAAAEGGMALGGGMGISIEGGALQPM